MSSNRTASSFSMQGGCWNAGPTCPTRAGNRCPGKALKPGVHVEGQCVSNVWHGFVRGASRWKGAAAA
eukprot:4459794-Pyramimonas_sp.AAC.1